jgi:hypothetical protein
MRGIRVAIIVIAIAAAGCGGDGPSGVSVCDNQVPPPAACMTQCDPAPGAPTTCPGGYHCTEDGKCDAVCTAGGGECGDGYRCTPDGRCAGNDECIGLECKIVKCDAQGKPPTSISGTVFAPNGTLPLFGINVYIPNTPVAAPPDGSICDRCGETLPGYPISKVQTDESGHFVLTDVPAGANIPLIISSGKWRRTLTIPNVAECADTPLTAADTRLPKNKSEGSIPKIAISTGSADALECLVRKLGIDDAEMGTMGGAQRIHMYADNGSPGQGANKFKGGFAGGMGNFTDSKMLWNTVGAMQAYDIVILSCEGGQYPETKSQAALDAAKTYADLGGRIFLSHWHNIWVEGSTEGGGNQAPAVWPGIADWNNSGTTFTTPSDVIDEANNPKGNSFATWMLNVMGSPAGQRGIVPIGQDTGKNTVNSIDNAKAERWVYWPQGGTQRPQMFQFTTPNEAPQGERCGKVVFSDMHVSGNSTSTTGTAFPDGCSAAALTPQEKALAFMFFDIASCVAGPIF